MTNQAAFPPTNPPEKAPGKRCWIAHVDLDAFFASCEQRDEPSYRGRPVVVGALPGKRGVVAAASYEARRFGIHSAMPISEAWRRCPEAIYLRPNMEKYSAASKQVFAALTEITPAIEKASIDEAYLDISGLEKLHGTPEEIGQKIKACILAATGLKASVGIGPNRLIAKLGSDYRKPDGLIVVSPDEVANFLAPMPISNLRGAGKQTQKKFSRIGITTIGQLRQTDPAILNESLGRHAANGFLRQANGIASTEVRARKQRKSISKERTFAEDRASLGPLREQLNALAGAVAHTARQKKLAGRVVKLKIRFSGFETFTRQQTLDQPSNDPRTLFDTAWSLFTKGDLPAKPVRLIGIGLSGWQNDGIDAEAEQSQGDLFQANETSRHELLATIDEITQRYGPDSLNLGLRSSKNRRQ
jgi:DNA polymerase-4